VTSCGDPALVPVAEIDGAGSDDPTAWFAEGGVDRRGLAHPVGRDDASAVPDAALAVELSPHRFGGRHVAALDESRRQAPADEVRSLWRALCEPATQRQFVLLFDLVGRTASAAVDGQLESLIVSSWVETIVDRLVLGGWTRQDDQPLATLLLAQFRGLQLTCW
jgi:hypothetical protein